MGATPPLNLLGDVTGPPNANVLSKIDGITLPAPTGVNTVPTYNSGAFTWVASSGGGGSSVTGTGLWYSASGTLNSAAITLTGDLTQGALSGNNLPVTVTSIDGSPVSISSPSLSQVLTWNGSDWANAALPVSSGSTEGVIKLTQDLGGTAALPEVVGLLDHGLPSFGTGVLQANGSTWSLSTVATSGLAPGTSAQLLMSNATPATTWTTVTGDTVISATGVTTTEQCTGSGGVCTVPNGTNLSFVTTGDTLSTLGRVNFEGDVAQTLIAFHYNGNDYDALHTDSFGSLQMGDVKPIPEIDFFALGLARLSGGNQSSILGLNASSATFSGGTKVLYTSMPALFDSSSNIQLGGTTSDWGGGAGVMGMTAATTNPSSSPTTGPLIYGDHTNKNFCSRGTAGTISCLPN
jgi:hypothetical protein